MKKYLYLIILYTIIPIISQGVNLSDNKPVFSMVLSHEGINTYKIPMFLIRYALNFSEDAKELKPLFKDADFVKIAICNSCERDYKLVYDRICKRLDLSTYKTIVDLIKVRSKVTVKVLFDKEIIREIVVLIHDEDNNLIALSITGEINPHTISDAIVNLNKSKMHNL